MVNRDNKFSWYDHNITAEIFRFKHWVKETHLTKKQVEELNKIINEKNDLFMRQIL